MDLNPPLVGSEDKSLLESINTLLERANREIEAQAMSPGDAEAWLECYVQLQLYAKVKRLLNEAIDSILRVHPELSERGVSR